MKKILLYIPLVIYVYFRLFVEVFRIAFINVFIFLFLLVEVIFLIKDFHIRVVLIFLMMVNVICIYKYYLAIKNIKYALLVIIEKHMSKDSNKEDK